MKHQRTISNDVELKGRGLFTGEPVAVRMRPGEPNTGIWFVRTDQSPPIRIRAHVDNISKRARRTALHNGTVAIETVEHCLSACAGLDLDNLQIELNANEMPAMDGSSLMFVQELRKAGIREQEPLRTPYVISEVIRVVDGDSELVALPPLDSQQQEHLEISYDLDYGPGNPIGGQSYRVLVTPESFEANIAPARTFVLEEEAVKLCEAGLGSHLRHEDILVFGKDGPIDNRLRFPDECARHKILDLIGDLSLFGSPIAGRIFARKSGHSLNHTLARALVKQHARVRRKERQRTPLVGIHKIQKILPHRYPFLMVDRILEIEGSERITGIKNVSINESFFQGHYPGDPIMPGVLIIEALAQIGGILLSQELEHKGKVAILLSLDKVKFRRAVRPGDQLILQAETIRVRSSTGHIRGRASVNDELAAEAEIKFILTDAESK